jgi:hypothetical protein
MRPRSKAPSGSGRRRALALCIATLLIGLLLGRSLSGSSSPTGGGRAAAPASAGAARTLAGVPVAFPDTAQGAASAVAAYQRAFADPTILRPGGLRSRIETVATPDYTATMLRANSPGAARIAAGPIGEGLRSGVRTLYAAVPIGYRVESFSPQRARVLTWGFTLLGNSTSVEPAAYFGLTKTELLWMHGRWRIAETRGGFGPTPKLATPPGSLGAFGVIDVMRGLHGYELAP